MSADMAHVPGTKFTQQLCAPHQCDHRCQVVREFGNLYRCISSGVAHICDANCDQRIQYDRYSTICKISQRVLPLEMDAMAVENDRSARKRQNDSPLPCSSRKTNKCDQVSWPYQSEDAMVM